MLDYEKAYEKELFSKMTRKEKLEHILTYYKFPLILGVIGLFVIGWCLWHFVISPAPATGLEFCFFSKYNNANAAEALEAELNEIFSEPLDGAQAKVLYLTDFIGDRENAAQEQAVAYKIMGEITAANMDIFVTQGDSIPAFATESYFMPLTDIFTEEELSEIRNALAAKAGAAPEEYTDCFISSYIDEDEPEKEYPVAINCEHIPSLSNVIPLTGDCYMAVIANTERTEMVRKVLIYYIFEAANEGTH